VGAENGVLLYELKLYVELIGFEKAGLVVSVQGEEFVRVFGLP